MINFSSCEQMSCNPKCLVPFIFYKKGTATSESHLNTYLVLQTYSWKELPYLITGETEVQNNLTCYS